MRKKVIIMTVSLVIIVMFGGMFAYLWPKVKRETFDNAALQEVFENEGHYYVYFYRDDCRYCTNIETEINDFANTVELYRVNTGSLHNTQEYDWHEHGAKFDVEIGKIDENGNIEYYHNMNEKDIMEMFPPVNYKIILATEGYVAMHDEKTEGKVYAISTHPFLSETDLQVNNFVLPGVPILIEIEDKKVANYYFDDKEIIAFLNSETKPIGEYWNLN